MREGVNAQLYSGWTEQKLSKAGNFAKRGKGALQDHNPSGHGTDIP